MSNQIAICVYNNGEWKMTAVNANKIEQYETDRLNIWPPVKDVTKGQNWGLGEMLYLNNCKLSKSKPVTVVVATTPPAVPVAAPAPTENNVNFVYVIFFIATMAWLYFKWRNRHDH